MIISLLQFVVPWVFYEDTGEVAKFPGLLVVRQLAAPQEPGGTVVNYEPGNLSIKL